MRSLRAIVPLAVAASLVAVSPAAADAKAPAKAKAKAAGSDVVQVIYPSLVQVRIGRTERALERATRKVENNKVAEAATTLKVVRRQLAAAWRGTKYVIRTAPPPVPEPRTPPWPARPTTTRSARRSPRRPRPRSVS